MGYSPDNEGTAISRLIPIDEFNAATPVSVLEAEPTAVADFFVRSIFGSHQAHADSWTLSVSGAVDRPSTFTLDELRTLGETTDVVAIECAGNGRRLMDPPPEGVPWSLGAASVGAFTGVPLRNVLEVVAPSDEVVEYVFTGADRGMIEDVGELNYAFSLDADVAMGNEPSLIWGMNGGPLPAEHGGPLRLLVPGHYAMTSVKWLASITAVEVPYEGYFKERYRFFDHPEIPDGSRVGRIQVRSLITFPHDESVAPPGLTLRGVAWSGLGRIAEVAVQIDGGEWLETELDNQASEYRPVGWSLAVPLSPGRHEIAARATDEAGNTQPTTSPWNRRGFANNAVHRIGVTVG